MCYSVHHHGFADMVYDTYDTCELWEWRQLLLHEAEKVLDEIAHARNYEAQINNLLVCVLLAFFWRRRWLGDAVVLLGLLFCGCCCCWACGLVVVVFSCGYFFGRWFWRGLDGGFCAFTLSLSFTCSRIFAHFLEQEFCSHETVGTVRFIVGLSLVVELGTV